MGRVAVVTGGSRGIGAAISKALKAAGYKVAANYAGNDEAAAKFKAETGISFRSFRAWKRARHLLHFANQDINLAPLAQDIGYPDSTHFSHSIRRFYGLKPRAISSGSRDLAIYSSGRATVADSGWTQEAS